MFSRMAAVHLAQRHICRIMRARPPDVRACLPFDPNDPRDVYVWASARMGKREWTGEETLGYAVRRIVWDAQKAGRRKSSFCSRTQLDSQALPGSEAVFPEDIPGRTDPGGWHAEEEVAEELAACVVGAAKLILSPSRLRSKSAMSLTSIKYLGRRLRPGLAALMARNSPARIKA